MPTFRFAKLVRDKIPELITSRGDTPHGRTLDKSEYLSHLVSKLSEEAAEIQSADPKQIAEELADLQEIIDCLRDALNITPSQLEDAQSAKRQAKGSFSQRQYIDTVEVSKSSPWYKYFKSQPDKYPQE